MADPAPPLPARPTWSLTARMVIGLGGLLMIGGIVLSLAALAYGRAAARDAFDRLLVGAAANIADSVSIVDGTPVVDLPVSAFELLALAPEDRIAYQVAGPDGTVLTGYADLPRPEDRARGRPRLYDAPFGAEPARYILQTRRFAERTFSGSVEVIVGQTLRARTALARDITRSALIVLAIGGVAVLVLAALVVRRALRPLDRLAAVLAARDPQDLTRLDTAVPREIAGLVEALNGFTGRLDRQLGTMRGLISDTAHQLRTPVAALRAQADLATKEPDLARRDMLVDRIHQRSVGLGRLLDQMLSRALVAHRIDAARREILDLRDIALDVVESGDHQLLAPGMEIRLDIGASPVPLRADAFSLTEAARNLLGNALVHGAPPVRVGADHTAGQVSLWVEDAGPGPAPELRARLGDRFLRDAASSGKSAGLGLAIAQSVAGAYGGAVKMETRATGFRISLTFPEGPE
ncbi:sensor histidine kinase [Pseudooceanicola aestuarii]|uniref:sensor histidine kinase n=1 Tax=Pseudooceanicola aestuarii TaxID=2697319 RepID=UPI0013D86E18|nr:sensor histidine kinase [Pseudooceanicola aestuarii]